MLKLTRWIYDADQTNAICGLEYLRMLGYHRHHATYPLETHHHQAAFEFVFIEKGKATWEVDGIYYPTNAGDLFHTRPHELHRARYSMIEPCQLWWFIIDTPSLAHTEDTPWFLTSHQEASVIMDQLHTLPRVIQIGDAFSKQMYQLRQIIEHRDALHVLRAQMKILDVLIMLTEHAEITQTNQEVVDFKKHLSDSLSADGSWRPHIDEIAQQFGYSASHFHKLFREQVGLSPIAYLERLRIEQACRLLEQTNDKITTIAIQMGYASSQHFATMFQRYMGYTPSQWRWQSSQKEITSINKPIEHK